MEQKIKEMVQNGFANKRISTLLNVSDKLIKELINKNNWQLEKEPFSENKIDRICELYAQGVSAKQLGMKFSIDKRRIQKWASERSLLRSKSDAHRFTEFNQHIFDTIDNEEKAYWLGFFYADAYNSNTVNTISVSLQLSDLSHLKKLSNFAELPISKITYTKTKEGYEYHTLKMYSKYLCNKLNELGCPQAKSFIIQYPDWLDPELNKSFIRGLFDGDGCITYREDYREWKWSLAGTDMLCEKIQEIFLKELGIIVNYHNISETGHNTCELEQAGNVKISKILKWLYDGVDPSIYLERKYQKYLDLLQHQDSRIFSRENYKVSENEKIMIKSEIELGGSVGRAAKEHNLHPRTITKIISSPINNSSYDQIVEINGQAITAKHVKTLDFNERVALIEPLFNHFRQQGWLYPDNSSKLLNNFKKLCDWQPDLSKNELFNNGSLATDICKYFCHQFYDATESGSPTMKEIFENDDKLKILIKNRLGLDWWDNENNDETFNISFKMLVQGMRSSRLVPSISIFKPNIAKYMYLKYSELGDTVYDYSAGWGGRMLGAVSCGRKYIGADPLTTNDLQNMCDYFKFENISLINNGSEYVKLRENSIDFSFSSPPYFDQEVYSKDITQAYNQGENYFYNIYWKQTLQNVRDALKPNKWFGLNIKNYPKMLEMAAETFGKIEDQVSLRTIRSHLNKTAGTEKNEYVYLFLNRK